MKLLIITVLLTILFGCSSAPKIPPSYTFKVVPQDCPNKVNCKHSLSRHSESTIETKDGNVVRLYVKSAYVASLSEDSATEKGELGNRELLLYATIYKNGQFLRYAKIIDIAEHVSVYQPVVIHKPIFFTETIDGYYHIVLKGYEVDTKTLVKMLRRIRSTDVETLEKSSYLPVDTFTAGLKNVVFGLFDMVLSITGKSLDDWVSKYSATKVFEHSIYVIPNDVDLKKENLLIVGSGDKNYFEKCGVEHDVKKCKADTDKEIYDTVITNIKQLEDKDTNSFTEEELKNGEIELLTHSPYLWIVGEHLEPKE